MAKNRLLVSHEGSSIQLFRQRGQSVPRSAPSVTFQHPFDTEALTELRWYLEEYLRFPYGLEQEKAKRTEQKFQVWGQQLFELVFPRTTKAWDFFQEATREGLDQCELSISSDDPAVLNLPWELLYSPDYQFLALSLAGMYRSLNGYAVRAEMPDLPQDKLNILLVIARPYGEKDIALKTIARPLLEALKPIQKQVNLKVLRPPSFEQFERELNEQKVFYHIVHFDGHGNFDPTSQGFQHSLGGLGQGVLVFEHLDGSPQIVTAAQIAQSLTDCRVPIFMLNACNSAQEGEGSFSSVATRLVALGAKCVVAMAYSVYAEAAKHFIGRVYEQLVRGNNLSNAVAAGRREILNKRQRPSPKGDLTLQDWLVPMLYQQETYAPFTPSSSNALDIEFFLEEPTTSLIGFPKKGAYGFVGRDYDILRLERAFRQNSIVLLQGMAGVGKTQLAYGFAQWLTETQGRSLCFLQSFEYGASLVNVVSQIGRPIWGDKFLQYTWDQQQTAVLNYLKTQPCLLIWDNFESVTGFPSSNEPLLIEEERESLKRFLKELRGGQSWVLVTSRKDEPWLDCGYVLHPLQGLSQVDTEELAAKILQSAGIDRETLPLEYLELLKLLGGHPLSMRVVLPHLRTQNSAQLNEALRRGLDTFAGVAEEGRERSLIASLDYSFRRLSELTRRHLPFLAFFSTQVDVHLLQGFSSEGASSELKKSYQSVFGESLNKSDWSNLLNEATMAGILEQANENIYKLHPALPWYLRQQLEKEYEISIADFQNLEQQILKVYAALSSSYNYHLIYGDAERAALNFGIDEPNLLHYLRSAEQQQAWTEAHYIFRVLQTVYERNSRQIELKALRQRIWKQLNYHLLESKGLEAHKLWIDLRSLEAGEFAKVHDLKKAKAIYLEILDELTALNDFNTQYELANIIHNLGGIARKQRYFEEAIVHFNQAVQIQRSIGDNYGASQSYFQLGIVAHEQLRFDEAIAYHSEALQSCIKLGATYDSARIYHELGYIAQEQQRFDEAIQHFNRALQIKEEAGDTYAASYEYHHLGIVAYMQQRFDEAVKHFRKAIRIREDVGDFYLAASDYDCLGLVANTQCQSDDAIAYYIKSLQIYQATGDDYNTAITYHRLGKVAREQQRFDDAVEYYTKALQIDEQETGDRAQRANGYLQLGNIAFLQQRLENSLVYYPKALQIYEEDGALHPVALGYYQSGRVAQQRQHTEAAIALYSKALWACMEAGNPGQLADEYDQLGYIAFSQRRLEEATEFYTKALQAYEKAGDVYRIARSYHRLGIIAQNKRQFEQAVVYYTNARQIYEEAGDTYRAADEYHQLGNIAFAQQYFEKAITYYTQALQIYEEAGDRRQMADEYHQLGYVAFAQQRYEEAMTYYTQALQFKEEAGDHLSAAYTYHQIGMVAQRQHRLDEAVDCYTKALRIKEELGDWYKSATDYHSLGTVAQEQQRYNDALIHYQKALQIYETADDAYNAAVIICQIGRVAQEQQRFNDAISYYQQALEIYETSGETHDVAKVAHLVGDVFYLLGSKLCLQNYYDEAIDHYQKALQIFEACGNASRIAEIYYHLGTIKQIQRRFEDASAYYRKALQIFEAHGERQEIARISHKLGLIAREKRYFDEAITHQQKALQIFKSTGNIHETANVFYELGVIALEQRYFENATALFQKALQVWEINGYTHGIAIVYQEFGIIARHEQRFEEASAHCQRALKIFKANEDQVSAAGIYQLLGNIAISQERFEEAVVYYQKTLQICEAFGDEYRAADAYSVLGNIAVKKNKLEEASAYYRKALKVFEQVQDFYKVATTYHNLGVVAQEQQRIEEAVTYYQNALQIFEMIGEYYSAASEYHRLGEIAQSQQRFEEAITFYQKLLTIYEASGERYNTAGIYYQLGVIARGKCFFDEAIGFYQKALMLCRGIEEAKPYSARILHCIGVILHQQHRFEEAIACHQEALNIYQESQNLHSAADTHYNLGILAQEQQRIDQAIIHYAKALMFYISVNDKHGASYPARQLRKILQTMKESQFQVILQQGIGEKCSTHWLEVIQNLGE